MFRAMIVAAAMVVASPAFADPVRFAVTDIKGLETLQQEFGAFEEAQEKSSGLEIELFLVSSRTAAVEALNSGKVELVLTGPAEYVVMKELADPKIVVGWQRPNYYAQIVTLTDGPIDNVSDLKGKTVTFGSVGSTSQHLGPSQILADFGLGYNPDYKAQIISRNVAVEALIRGDIHAVGMNEGHLRRIRAAFPDVAFSVVARGRDLPNDILVARRDADPAMVEKVRDAFLNDGKDLIAAVIKGEDNNKYEGGFFLTSIEDSNYDFVRSMYNTIGVSMNSFVGN